MENSELYTVFPVFILVDASASMAGAPIEAVNAAILNIKNKMLSNPAVGEIVGVCVMTFSDIGRTVIPFRDLTGAEIPEITVERGTNFAAAFREAKSAIMEGLRSLPKGTPFYRPTVFFMSDGEHTAKEQWGGALSELTDKSWEFAPEIVCFGLGDAARDTTALRRIATRFAFLVKESDLTAQVGEIMNSLLNIIRTTSTSVRDPAHEGLRIEAPAEHLVACRSVEFRS
jgi:uncharacterized protein YegL